MLDFDARVGRSPCACDTSRKPTSRAGAASHSGAAVERLAALVLCFLAVRQAAISALQDFNVQGANRTHATESKVFKHQVSTTFVLRVSVAQLGHARVRQKHCWAAVEMLTA